MGFKVVGDSLVSAKSEDQPGMICDSFHSGDLACARYSSNRISIADEAYGHAMDDENINTQGKRLRWARQRAGFATAKDAARKLRIGEVSYRAYENDQHGFTRHALQIAKTFGVDVRWLLEGGPTPSSEEPQPGELGTPLDLADKYGIELVRKVDITYAMGDGSVIEDYPETEFLPFSLNFLSRFTRGATDRLFIATGIGDSMEPTLRRDDLVMIDANQNRIGLQDEIWALAFAGSGMIKRVRRFKGGMVQLLSDNPSVPPMEIDEEDLYVVGKVVWVARVM